MNERIRELAKQARDWAEVSYKKQNEQFTSHWDTPIGYTPTQFFEQKFAELIVEECVGIVAKRKDQAIDNGWNVDEAMSMAEMDLEEHFGVTK